MTPEQIVAKADELRKEGINYGNYKRVFNDALVLIRELSEVQMVTAEILSRIVPKQ